MTQGKNQEYLEMYWVDIGDEYKSAGPGFQKRAHYPRYLEIVPKSKTFIRIINEQQKYLCRFPCLVLRFVPCIQMDAYPDDH